MVASSRTYRAWVDSVNASGGIDGRSIQLIVKDDAGSPGTSLTDAKDLISEHVDAITDDSVVDQTWASTVESAGIPVVGMLPFSPTFYSNPDFYPESTTLDAGNYAVVVTAKSAGATNFGVLYCAESPACQEGVPLFKVDGKKVGVPLTFSTSISGTAPNYTAQCVAAKQSHVQALFIGNATPAEPLQIGSDCTQQDYDPIYIMQGGGLFENDVTAPGLKDDLWAPYGNIPWWDDTPAIKAMNAAVDKYYPGLRTNTSAWGEGATQAWASGVLLEDAVKAAGLSAGTSITAADIVRGLDSLKGDTLDGLAPPLTFTAGKDHPVDCWFTTSVKNGVRKLVDGGQVTCESGSTT